MSNVYPKKIEVPEVDKLDASVVAASCIEQMVAGKTKAEAIGPVLSGSDDVDTFNTVWDSIIASGQAMRCVNPSEYETEEAYLADLETASGYLNASTWYAGLLAEKEVESFSELITLYDSGL